MIPAFVLRFLIKYKAHLLMAVGMVAGEKVANRLGDWLSSVEQEHNPTAPPEPLPPSIEAITPLPLSAFKEILKDLIPTTAAPTAASSTWFNLENGIDSGMLTGYFQ